MLLNHFSRARLCANPQTAAHQAPPSLGLSRQEHWSGLPFPSPMHESEKWKGSRSVMSDSLRPHGLQPSRLLHPWDFPGKNTGVGCHCLLRDKWIVTCKRMKLGPYLTWYIKVNSKRTEDPHGSTKFLVKNHTCISSSPWIGNDFIDRRAKAQPTEKKQVVFHQN